MRILIGYDGSSPADAALRDLRRAGLPKRGEALVISVADVLLPPSDNEGVDNTLPTYLPPAVRRAQERAARAVEEAAKFAERASKQISSDFPEWRVRHEAFADSPAWAVIRKADEWKPDLVVVGSHGQPALAGRLILGSASQRILYEVRCSVRVGRRRAEVDDSTRHWLDGSPNSQAALRAVSLREWPARTEIRVVAAVDAVMAVRPDPARPSEEKWIEVDDEHPSGQIHQVFEASAAQLRSAGLNASVMIKKGNPKDVLLK